MHGILDSRAGHAAEGTFGAAFPRAPGFRTYVPRTKDRVVRRGRKVSEIASLFPSYIFILIEFGWYAARFTPGLSAIVMYGDRPACVPDAVIADLHGRERNGLIRLPSPPKPTEPFVAGDLLRVRSGPLTGLNGLYAGDGTAGEDFRFAAAARWGTHRGASQSDVSRI